MQRKKNRVIKTAAILLSIMALLLGLFVSQSMHRTSKFDHSRFHGTWLDEPRKMSDFNLTSTQGPFTNAGLQHQWTMMFFGFTTCPSVCPTTMAELAKMTQILEKEGVTPMPRVILVSLDTERDTLEKLQQYVTAFHPTFVGARGENPEAVKTMANEVGVAYTKVALPGDKNPQHYNIEHTGTVMLFNPEGKLSAFFTMPHHAKSLAQDYQLAIAPDRG